MYGRNDEKYYALNFGFVFRKGSLCDGNCLFHMALMVIGNDGADTMKMIMNSDKCEPDVDWRLVRRGVCPCIRGRWSYVSEWMLTISTNDSVAVAIQCMVNGTGVCVVRTYWRLMYVTTSRLVPKHDLTRFHLKREVPSSVVIIAYQSYAISLVKDLHYTRGLQARCRRLHQREWRNPQLTRMMRKRFDIDMLSIHFKVLKNLEYGLVDHS